jgi:hypothetical protein
MQLEIINGAFFDVSVWRDKIRMGNVCTLKRFIMLFLTQCWSDIL